MGNFILTSGLLVCDWCGIGGFICFPWERNTQLHIVDHFWTMISSGHSIGSRTRPSIAPACTDNHWMNETYVSGESFGIICRGYTASLLGPLNEKRTRIRVRRPGNWTIGGCPTLAYLGISIKDFNQQPRNAKNMIKYKTTKDTIQAKSRQTSAKQNQPMLCNARNLEHLELKTRQSNE